MHLYREYGPVLGLPVPMAIFSLFQSQLGASRFIELRLEFNDI